MSFFSQFSDFIDSPVGNALKNLPEDVRRVKRNFKTIGIFDDDTENGYVTRELDDAIKIFQRDNDLKVDGRINPRGETESRIWDVLSGGLEKIDRAAKQPRVIEENPRGGIGFGTGVTDFKIDRRPYGHTVFLPETDISAPVYDFGKPSTFEPRGPFVFSLNDKKPETDATGHTTNDKQATSSLGAQAKVLDKLAERKAKNFGDKGLFQSQEFLNHYRQGKGLPVKLTTDEINKRPVILNAVQTNRRRFEDSITKGYVDNNDKIKSPFKDQILKLKDGDSVVLHKDSSSGSSDFWDRDISIKDAKEAGDLDFANALGNTKLRSFGSMKATRKGNVIEIEGVVDNKITDLYDFNEDDIQFSPFRKLAEVGSARPFLIHGSKLEKVKGRLKVEHGKLKVMDKFTWENIDQIDINK